MYPATGIRPVPRAGLEIGKGATMMDPARFDDSLWPDWICSSAIPEFCDELESESCGTDSFVRAESCCSCAPAQLFRRIQADITTNRAAR